MSIHCHVTATPSWNIDKGGLRCVSGTCHHQVMPHHHLNGLETCLGLMLEQGNLSRGHALGIASSWQAVARRQEMI